MRRLLLVFVSVLIAGSASVSSCSPQQVAALLHKDVKDVTAKEVKNVSTAWDQFYAEMKRRQADPFLVCTRAHESDTAGGYQAYSSAGPYYGAYQFLRSTWDKTAAHAYRFDLIGVDPRSVVWWDQDAMAMSLYQWQGNAPWGGRC